LLTITSYVLAISLVATPFLAFAHGMITGSKRKAAKVPYPNAYASAEEMKANPAAYQFNCAQRAHAQFMENAPQTMLSMVISGLVYPNATIALGLGWYVSRVLYLYGYVASDKPKGNGRYMGSFFWLAQFGLTGLVGMAAWRIIS
jgi:glutathione S-transferase